MKHFTLSNGAEIPAVGYGSFQATDGYGKRVIKDALEVGYRYIDTATLYRRGEQTEEGKNRFIWWTVSWDIEPVQVN